jgi:hypothetical protein
MRWDAVIPDWVDRLLSDALLIQHLGGEHIYPGNASVPVRVPSIQYGMTGDRPTEIFNEIQVQVNIFARGIRLAGLIEKRVRLLTHKDVGQDLGGERMWLQCKDARDVDFPSDPGVIHRALDIEITPVRNYNAA